MDERRIDWRGSSYKDLCEMPEPVRRTFGFALGMAQNNLRYEHAKTLAVFKPALVEILEDDDGDTTGRSTLRTMRTSFTCSTASRRSPPRAETCRSATRRRSRRGLRR